MQDKTHLKEEPDYKMVPQGIRLANFLIDLVAITILGQGLSILLYMPVLKLISPETYQNFMIAERHMSYSNDWILFTLLMSVVTYVSYYTSFESVFAGRTIGKFITRTKAIRQDGRGLTLKDAFLRTLVRLIPFEPFSGFTTLMWHDRWTKTQVVRL